LTIPVDIEKGTSANLGGHGVRTDNLDRMSEEIRPNARHERAFGRLLNRGGYSEKDGQQRDAA